MLGSALLVSLLAVSLSGAALGATDDHEAHQLVRSPLAPRDRALALSTSSLYAKHDPWKAYLASDRVCPGGERTDLPVAKQLETVTCLVNFARRRRGLRALEVVVALNGGSSKKAAAIVRCQEFSHDPCGIRWTAAVRSTGYSGDFGENLYIASGRWAAARVAVDAWLNSESHRDNLFGTEWRGQGIAVLNRKAFGGYRNVSVWVSVLGDSRQP